MCQTEDQWGLLHKLGSTISTFINLELSCGSFVIEFVTYLSYSPFFFKILPSLVKCSIPFYLFIYLFMAELGLCCCTWAFSSCGERGLLFLTVSGLLIAVASLVEHGL